MNPFDVAAILVTLAALFGYLNHRFLKFPSTIGILIFALANSLIVLGLDILFPAWHLQQILTGFLTRIDFNQALMHGMLSFLLFAGAIHVDLGDLKGNGWAIGSPATLGVVLSTVLVGALTHFLFAAAGVPVALPVCLVFGALISPTDPIAVMGLLKHLGAPRDLKALIAGESLLNDGVGVVVFLSMASLAGLGLEGVHPGHGPVRIFLQEVLGGTALGLGMGYVAYRALKSINEYQLELMITLALVMGMYALSFRLHVSGPIAVVVAGVILGNPGRKYAMSERTTEYVEAFWGMLDEILNAVLFLLIGLEVLAASLDGGTIGLALLVVPVVLAARWVSVALPLSFPRRKKRYPKGALAVLTWGGLRGGISVALMLSLPPFPEKGLLLAATYAVVLFSVLVQGLTMPRLFRHYGIGK